VHSLRASGYGVGLRPLGAGIAGSNSAEGVDVRLLCYVGSGRCDGLIIGLEESYRLCVSVI